MRPYDIMAGSAKADNAKQKGPKADQAAGRLLLRFTLVEFTLRGSDLLVGLYFYSWPQAVVMRARGLALLVSSQVHSWLLPSWLDSTVGSA